MPQNNAIATIVGIYGAGPPRESPMLNLTAFQSHWVREGEIGSYAKWKR